MAKPFVWNVVTLVTAAGERYYFFWDDESWEQINPALGRFAASPDLSFSWYDAAVLSQKVRRLRLKKAG